MRFAVYILVNEAGTKTYVGQTDDVQRRLHEHNAGYVRSTRGGGPWKLLHQEACGDRAEAMKREKYYKSPAGRKKLRGLF